MNPLQQSLSDKSKKLAVIGLGYVGLPVALAFAKKISVIGFDLNVQKIEKLRAGTDLNGESDAGAFDDTDIIFTSDPELLTEAHFFIVTVPTPVDESHVPDLKPLIAATETIGRHLKAGDYVVFESTTYPGCTEDICLPVLEKYSGLKSGEGFKIGYSPERINPGDPVRRFSNLPKVVSGGDGESLETIAAVYGLVVQAPLHKAPSIRVAEAAKVVENTQRDMNIALMNELSIIFDRMHINTTDVLEAAAGKWNFMPFSPGLVGGHCTGVDPYYLAHKASSLGYDPALIAAARKINDGMSEHVARRVAEQLSKPAGTMKILVKGVTFKENVSDIRNSKIADTVKYWQAQGIAVEIEDPHADPEEVEKKYGLAPGNGTGMYDAVVVTVPHREYLDLDDAWFCSVTHPGGLVADLKSIYKNKILNRKYWSL